MFLDEARIAARIHHPNVVSTLDVVAADGELFVVLEYVHGESLARLLKTAQAQRDRCPPLVAASIRLTGPAIANSAPATTTANRMSSVNMPPG